MTIVDEDMISDDDDDGGLPTPPTWGNGGTVNIPIGTSGAQSFASIINSLRPTTLFSASSIKNNIKYIIVPDATNCLELEEQQVMTPREMINICKFINMATASISNATSVNWSELIKTLGIEKHFTIGEADYDDYDDDTETLNIFLFDGI